MRLRNRRGIILISSYLLLSLFLVYSNALALRTINQTRLSVRTHDQMQVLDLAQASAEQLRENLFEFTRSTVYQTFTASDMTRTLQWLDTLGQLQGAEVPTFDVTNAGATNGLPGRPRCVTDLPLIRVNAVCTPTTAAVDAPRAWIVGVANITVETDANQNGILDPSEDLNGNGQWDLNGDPLGPRDVTIQAEAQVGAVTKRIQGVYRFQMAMSDIFKYAYFLNNHGWMSNNGDGTVYVYGEVRSNGDLVFTGPLLNGEVSTIKILGDLYAAPNPERGDLGVITGDPRQWNNFADYSVNKTRWSRPALQIVQPGQPYIGMSQNLPPPVLPKGQGWDAVYVNQHFYPNQPPQAVPYLGDLTMYTKLQQGYKGGLGASLTYFQSSGPGPDARWGTNDDPGALVTITNANPYSSSNPLVLAGTTTHPIILDGPMVIPGDVIIRGRVQGRGTIYAGRNIHIVGAVRYVTQPVWPAVYRNPATGGLKEYNNGVANNVAPANNLGTVCQDGTYVAPGGSLPLGC